MAYQNETIRTPEGINEIYVWSEETPDERHLAYQIDGENNRIIFNPFPEDNMQITSLVLDGFNRLPDEFTRNGYVRGGVMYYLQKKCREAGTTELIIENDGDRMCRNFRGGISRMKMPYSDFQRLKNQLSSIKTESQRMRSTYVDEFFHDLYPNRFEVEESTTHVRRRRIIENLSPDIISDFSADEMQALENFYASLIEGRYISVPHKLRLVKKTKLKFDSIALDSVISRYEAFLADESKSEANWGAFLKENLFLIDSKYIQAIPEVILTLVRARQVDFGLMDYDSFLDIFEIKKPTTNLLAAAQDRNNYYWHTDAIKAIMQAEKYLHYAGIRAEQLQNDLRRQDGFANVQVLKPKVSLIIGKSDQLDTEQKREDFKILRNSLKNVEIILYDELLKRAQIQRERIF